MAINPELITTIRVDQLPDETLSLTNLFPHTVGTDLKSATIQELVDLVATSIGVSGGVGYIAISVTDGQQLPDVPELSSFFLCGAGTFLNINGYPDVICTDELNAVMSLSDHWQLAVGIPIVAEVGVQTVTGSAVDNTDPLNPIVNLAGSAGTLAEVLTEGNITDGTDISISDGDKILLDNGANLKKGTTDAGLGGSKGIALRCAVDYELKWEAGRLYVMGGDGFTIREVSHNFTTTPTVSDDDTKGFIVDSRWILDNGDVYVCTDATTGAAVWQLQSSGTPTLQEVLDNNHDLVDGNNFQGTGAGDSNTGTEVNAFGISAAANNVGNFVNGLGNGAGMNNEGMNINALGTTAAFINAGNNINALGDNAAFVNAGNNVNALGNNSGSGNAFNDVNLFGANANADEDGQTVLSKDGAIMARISTADLTETHKYNLPDNSGFIALTSDIPDTSTLVPYTGATANVNLGTHSITAKDLIVNHSSGSGDAATITKGGNGEALKVLKSSGSGNAASITGGVTLLDELHLTTDLADAYIASASVWNAKQAALVSATNIKTINGASVLGSGDLVVGGSSSLTVGTTPIASGTIGRVFFQGSGNVLQQSANLFWDNTNSRLGVGATPATTVRLDVRAQGALSTDIAFRVRNSADTANLFSLAGNGNTIINVLATNPILFGRNATFATVPSISMNNTLSDTLMAGFFADDLNFYINSPNRIILRGSGLANNSSFVISNGSMGQGYGSYDTNPSSTNGIYALGKIGVGTNTPLASAKLQVDSTTQGFLPPRMTTNQKNAIASPAAGLVVYDSTLNKLCVYTTAWETITSL